MIKQRKRGTYIVPVILTLRQPADKEIIELLLEAESERKSIAPLIVRTMRHGMKPVVSVEKVKAMRELDLSGLGTEI